MAICRGAPTISNFMFADDSILFYQATTGEVEVINEVIQTYANASGQWDTYGSQRYMIVSMLGVKEVE